MTNRTDAVALVGHFRSDVNDVLDRPIKRKPRKRKNILPAVPLLPALYTHKQHGLEAADCECERDGLSVTTFRKT